MFHLVLCVEVVLSHKTIVSSILLYLSRYIYTSVADEVENLTFNVAIDLLSAAEHFLLERYGL